MCQAGPATHASPGAFMCGRYCVLSCLHSGPIVLYRLRAALGACVPPLACVRLCDTARVGAASGTCAAACWVRLSPRAPVQQAA
eukprot:4559158-Alexandrium_andersonii.AAC.1